MFFSFGKWRYILAGLTYFVTSGSAFAQNDLKNISVDDPRPLAYAIKNLAKDTGATITFEENVFEASSDLKDYDGRLGPPGGLLVYSYPTSSKALDNINGFIKKYEETFPGSYKVLLEDNIYHVVPSSSKDLNGSTVSRTSILDASLTIDLMNVTAQDVFCAITEQLSERVGKKVMCGATRNRALVAKKYDHYSLSNAPARVHLVKLIRDSGAKTSWMIFRDVNNGWYSINLYSY